MKRKCKLIKFYDELGHMKRQNPNGLISIDEVLIRMREIVYYLELDLKLENVEL